jgi:hypothetical protein
MAGVIVTILKIIGIIIVSILALFLILIGVFLFLPVQYQLRGSKDAEKAELSLSVNWLCHLFRVRVNYAQDSGFVYTVKLLFFQLFPRKEKPEKPVKPQKQKKPQKEEKPEKIKEKAEVKEKPTKTEAERIKQPDKTVEIRDTNHKSADKKVEIPNKKEKDTHEESEHDQGIQKIKKKIEKLKFTFQNICDKIKGICSSCEKFKKFITSEEVKGTLKFLNEQRKYLVRHLKPSKADVYLHFGTEDPALTGQILAALSVLHPFYGYRLDIEPDFEQAVFEGNVFIKGNVQFYAILLTVWRAYKNQYIRKMIDRVRK